ncbi:MAG: DUF2231 domain-containing protein [Pseudomonadota bacterium]
MQEHASPGSTAKIAGHPIHPMIIPFPIASFVGAFVTDLVYSVQGADIWALASMWLLGAGLATALLAAIAGFVDFATQRGIREHRAAWIHMIGNLSIVALQALNFLIRTGDPQAAVAPWGLVLSFIAFVGLHITGWMGWSLVYRHGVAVRDSATR